MKNFTFRNIALLFLFTSMLLSSCHRAQLPPSLEYSADSILIPFLTAEGYKVVDQLGNTIIKPTTKSLSVDNYEKTIKITSNDSIYIYNSVGKLLIEGLSSQILTERVSEKTNFLKIINPIDKTMVFINPHTITRSKKYKLLDKTSIRGAGAFMTLKKGDGWVVIDENCMEISSTPFKSCNFYYENRVTLKKFDSDTIITILSENQLSMVNARVISPRDWAFDIIENDSTSYIVAKNGSILNTFDRTGLNYLNDSTLYYQDSDSIQVISISGENIFQRKIEFLHGLKNNLSGTYFAFKKDFYSKYGLLDITGEVVLEPKYEKITPFGEGGLCYTTKEGIIIVDSQLDSINFVEGVRTPSYDDSKKNMIRVTSYNVSGDLIEGIIDKRGNWILPLFETGKLSISHNDQLIMHIDDNYTLYNNSGEILFSAEQQFSYDCINDYVKINSRGKKINIVKDSGKVIKDSGKTNTSKSVNDPRIKLVSSPSVTPKTISPYNCNKPYHPKDCYKINVGIFKDSIFRKKKMGTSIESEFKLFMGKENLVPKEFRSQRMKDFFAPEFFSVSNKKEIDNDESKLKGLVAWSGEWIKKPSFAHATKVLNGRYYVYTDISKLQTTLYSVFDSKVHEEFDFIEDTGLLTITDSKRYKIKSSNRYNSPVGLITATLKNKEEFSAILKKVKHISHLQISKELLRKNIPKYNFSLHSDDFEYLILENYDYIERIGSNRFISRKTVDNNTLSQVIDIDGNTMLSTEGELNTEYFFRNSLLTLKINNKIEIILMDSTIITSTQYDSIKWTYKDNILLLYKDGNSFLKYLNQDNINLNNRKFYGGETLLGKGEYIVDRIDENYITLYKKVDKNDRYVFNNFGELIGKTKYSVYKNNVCDILGLKGYIKVVDPTSDNKNPFFINIDTNIEYRDSK